MPTDAFDRGSCLSELDQYAARHPGLRRGDPASTRATRVATTTGVSLITWLGQHQRALEDYNGALRINPQYARAYARRGIAQLYLRRDAEAESDFKKAFELDPLR